MKKVFNYFEENFVGIGSTLILLFFMIIGYIVSHQMSKSDIYDLEERCYNFYQENNYILDECYKYENKLKGMKD